MARLKRHPPGHQVTFKNPTTKEKTYGKIVDEVWAKEPEEFDEEAPDNGGWREGAFVAQLFEWPYHRSVRITYYIRPEREGPDSWRFGGQYSSSMSLEEYRSLFRKLQKKKW